MGAPLRPRGSRPALRGRRRDVGAAHQKPRQEHDGLMIAVVLAGWWADVKRKRLQRSGGRDAGAEAQTARGQAAWAVLRQSSIH